VVEWSRDAAAPRSVRDPRHLALEEAASQAQQVMRELLQLP
jgi:hypothetical protein